MKSIRKRLLLAFSLIELLLMLMVFALNYFLADDFFIKNNTQVLSAAIEEGISRYYPTNIPELSNFVSMKSGANVQIIFTDRPQENDMDHRVVRHLSPALTKRKRLKDTLIDY